MSENALMACLLAVVIAVCLWWEYTHPCLRTERYWVEAHIDLQHEPDGNVSPLYVPGKWEAVCVERGRRSP